MKSSELAHVKWLEALGLYRVSVQTEEAIHRRRMRYVSYVKAQAAERLEEQE